MRSERDGIDSTLIRMTATSRTPLSRADLAGLTGLSKMTIGRHVADLIQEGVLWKVWDRFRGKIWDGRRQCFPYRTPCRWPAGL